VNVKISHIYLVFLVLSGIGEHGYDGGDTSSRSDLASVNHDQQLHEVIVDLAASALNNKHIFATNRFANLDPFFKISMFKKYKFDVCSELVKKLRGLLVAELLGRVLAHLDAKTIADFSGQGGI
jgi:hypothetical protein